MSRFVWAKRKLSSTNRTRAFELRKAGVVYAVVQECGDGWFSYGLNGTAFNTANTPTDQLSAMKDALSRVRATKGGRE